MSQDIADMPGIESAMERFNELEDSSAKTVATTEKVPATRETKPADAPPTAKDEAQPSVTSPSDTPAPAEADATKTDKTDKPSADGPEKTSEQPADDKNKSRYSKAQERLEKTWEGVNKRKTELDTQTQKLEQEKLDLARQKAEFEAVKRSAEKPQHTPDDYLNASRLKKKDADAFRAQSKRAEDAGRFDEAEKLKKQADKADTLADDLAEHAEQIRKNPPPGLAERSKQFEQARQAWTMESAKAFPELAKEGSDFQKTVASHLNALAKQDPQLMVHPSVIYHVCRLTAAELKAKQLQTAAARVPVLEKEAESLRAKIKDLEALTAPAGEGSVPKFGGESADDYASLRQAAAEQPQLR